MQHDIFIIGSGFGGKLETLLAEDLQLKFAHDTEVSKALMLAG